MVEAFFSDYDQELVGWVILPLMIFFARIIDVSIGTLRIVFVSKGLKNWAPLLGFFEVLVWIITMKQIVNHATYFTAYIGWAAGFAAGNFVGLWIEERLALGILLVRVIIGSDASELVSKLRTLGFGVTVIDGQGSEGSVRILFTLVKRKDLALVKNEILSAFPKAFYTIEQVSRASDNVYSPLGSEPTRGIFHFLSPRKSK